GHLRHGMLHESQDDESARASADRQLEELSAHDLSPARDPDPIFMQLLLHSDVQVRDDEDVVRHEGGLIRDGLEIHVRSNGGSALWLCRVRSLYPRRGQSNSARTRPRFSASSTDVMP